MFYNVLVSSYLFRDPTGINYLLLFLLSIIMINDILKNISSIFEVPSWVHSLILLGFT